MTDTQHLITKFLDELYTDELQHMDEKSNDPYIMAWNECLNYIRTKSYCKMYEMGRISATTFNATLDK